MTPDGIHETLKCHDAGGTAVLHHRCNHEPISPFGVEALYGIETGVPIVATGSVSRNTKLNIN